MIFIAIGSQTWIVKTEKDKSRFQLFDDIFLGAKSRFMFM